MPRASRSTPDIVTYFSHSYREVDRPVNEFFSQLFHDAGFLLTVEPRSDSFSIPFLEMMMQRSSCFAAVMTYRPQQEPIYCSPYLQFEYGLAVLAQKPRLVFVDNRIPGRLFSANPDEICVYNSDPRSLKAERAQYKQRVDAFAMKLAGRRGQQFRLPNRIGFVADSKDRKSSYHSIFPKLQDLFDRSGFELEWVPLQFDRSYKVCLALEKFDFLLMDVRVTMDSPWMVGLALGRLVPCIYLCHLKRGETAKNVPLPTLSVAHSVQDGKQNYSSVVFWQETEGLLKQVHEHVSKFRLERVGLYSSEDCFAYFVSIGRPPDKVFLSNADSANDTVDRLKMELRRHNIRHFHYKNVGDIPIGAEWEPTVKAELGASKLFAALINQQYKKSHVCLKELEWALESAEQGKMSVLPYLLEHTNPPDIISHLQARPLYRVKSQDERLKNVVNDLDLGLRNLAAN